MNNTTWHEVGHAIFASIFKDFFYIEFITIQSGSYGKGVSYIKTKKEEESELDKFHLIIVCIAGLAVQFMQKDRKSMKTMEKIVLYLNSRLTQKNITDSFDGDFELLQEPLENLSNSTKKSKLEIMSLASVYIANCLIKTDEFWPAIDRLAIVLEDKKKLENKEIESILNQIGFNQYLIASIDDFYEESKRLLYEE